MMARGNESKPDERSENHPTIHELFEDGREIDLALERAIKEALLCHKKLGNSIVV